MDFQEFPKWKYKGDASTGVLVNSADEEKALGKGWKDQPSEAKAETPKDGDTAA